MDCEIIVLDLDGTLTNRGKIVTPRTKEALMNVQEAGNAVVLTSGRPTADVELLARELELSRFSNYILSYNGGMIVNCKTGETMFSSLLSKESNQEIIGLAEEHRIDILAYESEEIIINNVEYPYTIAESGINHLSLRQVEGIKSCTDFKAPKFPILDDGNYLVAVEPKVKAAMGHDFNTYRSEPYFLEIMPKGIDKARSLARLLEVLGLDREQVTACGNGYSDLTMTKYAGLDVVMENTVLPVGRAAGYITASNSHDGVGLVVGKFILP